MSAAPGWFALSLALAILGIAPLLGAGYLLLLTLLSRRPTLPADAGSGLRFAVVVPAHNEEAGIGQTVASLQKLEWPKEQLRLLVVADNCSDGTALVAQQAGASVWVRTHETLRAKGYALAFAFERLLAEGWADALVVVDADTDVSPNLLRAFAARLASGEVAVQADYAVRNPHDSWRTRLMAIALGAFHVVRSRGRERLRVSCGLRGNGMCFSAALLREVPHEAFSLVEDLEYGLRLGRRGVRVAYADEAHVYGEMVSSSQAARSQRLRWEHGRKLIARQQGPVLLREAVAQRSRILLDLAFDVLVPPLSQLAAVCVLGLALSIGLSLGAHHLSFALWPFGCAVASLFAYVVRGWALSGTGARGGLDLLLAPGYVAWKLTLKLRGASRPGAWVRTRREGGQVDGGPQAGAPPPA